MAVFKDESEVFQYIGGIFEEALADPEIGQKFADSGVILKVTYTEPNAIFTVDLPSKKVFYGQGAVNGPKPVVEMFMKADVAHQFWLGKVNISLALAKGQMRAKGPAPRSSSWCPWPRACSPGTRHPSRRPGERISWRTEAHERPDDPGAARRRARSPSRRWNGSPAWASSRRPTGPSTSTPSSLTTASTAASACPCCPVDCIRDARTAGLNAETESGWRADQGTAGLGSVA